MARIEYHSDEIIVSQPTQGIRGRINAFLDRVPLLTRRRFRFCECIVTDRTVNEDEGFCTLDGIIRRAKQV